jgi:protein TonB
MPPVVSGFDIEVVEIGDEPVQPPDPIEVAPTPPPVMTKDDDAFRDENLVPTPVRPRNTRPMRPIARHAAGGQRPASIGSGKVFALNAPRPDYPYEARRQRTTGTGVASLTVDFARGNVVDVRMTQSTGSPILDRATTVGLRRWRFKPGTVTTVAVPITFTLTGAIY